MYWRHGTCSSAQGGVPDAEGNSLKPPFLKGLLHWNGAEAEPCGLGKGDSRGTAEPKTFKRVSGLLPKPVLVLDGKNPSSCSGPSPSKCSVLAAGMEPGSETLWPGCFWSFPVGVGRAMPPSPLGQAGPGQRADDATMPRVLLAWGFQKHCPHWSGATGGSLQRGERRMGLQKLLKGFEFLIPIRN